MQNRLTISYFPAIIISIAAYLIFTLALAPSAYAQDADQADIPVPEFSQSDLRSRLDSVDNNEELTDEQKTQAKSLLDSAATRLADAARLQDVRRQYEGQLENGPNIITRLEEEITTTRAQLAEPPAPLGEMIGEEALYKLEQQLVQKESRLRTLQSEAEGYTKEIQSLATRQAAAPNELTQARERLAEVATALSDLGETNLDGVNAIRRQALIARQYYRRSQVAALEAELASLPQRQELLNARRTLANLKAELVARDVTELQEQTGQRRVNEADAIRQVAQNRLDEAADSHPAISWMAEGNLALAEQLKDIAEKESNLSKTTAGVRGQQVYVADDVTAATELVSMGNLDRQAGATLRRLENQFTSPREIRANLTETRRELSTATRQRIVAQERLRDLPLGRLDEALMRDRVKSQLGTINEALTPEDLEILQSLMESRRELLGQVTQAATTRINNLTELVSAQQDLLDETEQLQALLDENLLWVPSVPSIDLSWPAKVAKGAFEIVSPQNLTKATQVALDQSRALWPILLLIFLILFGLVRARSAMWAEVVERSEKVGRVTVDRMWHTPVVVLIGLLMALPFPLLFLTIGFVFASSDDPSPVIQGLENAFASLAIFAFIVITWRYWDRDKSLFGAHFKLPKSIRESVMRNLRWFIPTIGIGTFLTALTEYLPGENIAEGFSLLVFIAIALGLAYFGYRILWTRRKLWTNYLSETNALVRHRTMISVIVIGAPLIVAFLAAAGYLESADALLSRIFLSGVIALIGYVTFGTLRRAVVVAQRQIKYRQAIERRDAALKAREEKAAAEERGEEMPPPAPIDTSEIDVTTITRQSSQLLTIIVLIGLAGLLWMIWSDLLPALSFFDSFQVWEYDTGDLSEAGDRVLQSVTVWNLIQSLVIITLTFVAARNLPGFLEVFILNRMGVDAGTRYAVVTILGYIIVGIGVIISVQRLGLQWSQIKWIATGLSVGIGLGLQKIIANFVSGLIILFERPVRIGDYVTIGDQSGLVSRIQIRATTLSDLDNREILIPNEALISERVTNWTLSNSVTRLIVPVGIAYGSDTDKARDVMLARLKTIPKVLETPPPQVLFMGFGDSSLDFELRVFLKNFDDRVPMRHTIHTETNKALAEAGFSIPFPQRDLNIVSQNIPLQVMSDGKNAKKKPARKKAATKKPPPKTPPKKSS